MSKPKKRWILIFAILVVLQVISMWGAPVEFSTETAVGIDKADTAWMIVATAFVLFMTPGLSFFYGGMVSWKNVVSTMLQSFIALGVISLLWYLVGFSLAFGESFYGLIGNPFTYFCFQNVGLAPHPDFSPTIPFLIFALFQLKFAIITPALITGSFAERVKFTSYLLFMVLFALLIYAPLAHWTWHPQGFLRQWGVLDFAGGTVVHMSAGFAALAGAFVLGKREVKMHQPANIPFIMLGTGMLWFGWFGFNAGSALAANGLAVQAFATTNMASASAMLTWVLFDALVGRKISAVGACIGAVVGLVAITPAAGFVSLGQSVFIGFVAALVSNVAVYYKNKTSLDDTLDVFPCHGVGGIVGMILTAVFAKDVGAVFGNYTTLQYHLLALVIVGIFTFGGAYLIFKIVGSITRLRVSKEEEKLGLDISQHAETMETKASFN
ncbi:MAG: ammonium transporter [Cyclobacteriaceae bacterium]|jgi:Amt family ammonium transporter|nr:ammonium transporter [Cytophagales bacterium]MCZ8329596.1 ammonium transporter [Cyclobacteriaceae bacterium]